MHTTPQKQLFQTPSEILVHRGGGGGGRVYIKWGMAQFRLNFKGHISPEYCCLVMNLASVSTISYADSNDGIFLLVGSLGCIKPGIVGLTQSLSVRDY